MQQVEKHTREIIETPIENSPFLKPFKTFPSKLQHLQAEYLARAHVLLTEAIYPAVQKFLEFFVGEYYPRAHSVISLSKHFPEGDIYDCLLRFHTGADLTAQQIFQIGKDEVLRIRKRMQEVIEKVGFHGTLKEFIEYLRTEKKFYFQTEKELMDYYRIICKKIDPKLSKIIGKLPRAQYGIKKIPEQSAPSRVSAFYNGPSGDRPGIYYVNTYKLETRPKYEMIALACHETVPGHHIQISLVNEFTDFPQWRRNFEDRFYYLCPGREARYTGYVEGWGLYAEDLGEELNLYKDDYYSIFGKLSLEIWRACRCVVDTGIHAFGWTMEQAIEYMSENTALSIFNIQIEVMRYITWPGQGCAYKIGQLKIRELRELAQSSLGEKFNIKEFHDFILGLGPVSLHLLELKTKRWIQKRNKI